jgi:outer membrane protein assembly factor BamB
MYRQILGFATLGLLLHSHVLFAADWPQWRGPNRDELSGETGLISSLPKAGPKLNWTFKKAGVGYGSPSVVGKVLYLQGSNDPDEGTIEFVQAIDTETGKLIWEQPFSDNKSGKILQGWGSGPRGTPTVNGDFVYVLGIRGDLACLAKKDGSKVWSVNLVKDFKGQIPAWGYSESVLIDPDTNNLICTPGNAGGMVALKKTDGSKVWQCTEIGDDAGYSSIMISNAAGSKHYVQQTMKGAIGVSTEGKLLWKYAGPGYRTAVIPTPVLSGDYVFLTSGYGAGCSLLKISKQDAGLKADKVYTNKAMINHHGGVVRVGEYIYGYCDKNGWECLDFMKLTDDDEKPLWRLKGPEKAKGKGKEPAKAGENAGSEKPLDKGSVTFADGKLFCYGEGKGTLAMVQATPDGWKELGRFELPEATKFPRKSGKVWAHPVVANGKLYLRDLELLFQFDLKDPAAK